MRRRSRRREERPSACTTPSRHGSLLPSFPGEEMAKQISVIGAGRASPALMGRPSSVGRLACRGRVHARLRWPRRRDGGRRSRRPRGRRDDDRDRAGRVAARGQRVDRAHDRHGDRARPQSRRRRERRRRHRDRRRMGNAAEIGLARKLGRPVVVLEPGWQLEGDGITRAATPEEAVATALALARQNG